MEQYIKKSAIVAEIERKINEINLDIIEDWRNRIQREHDIEVIKRILSLIDTLEVKEEILDKEGKTDLMRKCVHKAYKRGYDMGVLQTTNKIKHNTKEVDLEKEISNYLDNHNLNIQDGGRIVFNNGDTPNFLCDFRDIAKHFFELGLKKGE